MAQFYKCDLCNKVVAVIRDGAGVSTCCGQDMSELVPGTVDASREKHVPYVTINGTEVTVQVGSTKHPMEEKHFIDWICIKTDRGIQLKYLTIGSEPVARFYLEKGEKLKTVYSYCNIHGLWSADI